MMNNPTGPDLDLLYGVPAIAQHLCMTAPQVYHLHDQGNLPTFKIGGKVCARRSTLASHFTAQEAASAGTPSPEPRRRNRQPGRAPGRPASVIVGASNIADRLGIDERELARLDGAREVPTYMADGRLCGLASELDRWKMARKNA